MVRLETIGFRLERIQRILIYIPVWLDQKRINAKALLNDYLAFTFQYGQIRNEDVSEDLSNIKKIYIPVWLDQKPVLGRPKIIK